MRLLGLILVFIVLAPLVALMELLLWWLDKRAEMRELAEDLDDEEHEDD